jgi:hypothetical protein
MCPFLAMDISEMDIPEMTSSNGIGIQICPFPICPFSDEPPFLPAPKCKASDKFLHIGQTLGNLVLLQEIFQRNIDKKAG